jgi:hypothetical protein
MRPTRMIRNYVINERTQRRVIKFSHLVTQFNVRAATSVITADIAHARVLGAVT